MARTKGRRSWPVLCAAGSSVESGGVDVEVEEEAGPVVRFESSDFAVCGHVSIGLAGRVRKIVAFLCLCCSLRAMCICYRLCVLLFLICDSF